jgi:hypothetical protein
MFTFILVDLLRFCLIDSTKVGNNELNMQGSCSQEVMLSGDNQD